MTKTGYPTGKYPLFDILGRERGDNYVQKHAKNDQKYTSKTHHKNRSLFEAFTVNRDIFPKSTPKMVIFWHVQTCTNVHKVYLLTMLDIPFLTTFWALFASLTPLTQKYPPQNVKSTLCAHLACTGRSQNMQKHRFLTIFGPFLDHFWSFLTPFLIILDKTPHFWPFLTPF